MNMDRSPLLRKNLPVLFHLVVSCKRLISLHVGDSHKHEWLAFMSDFRQWDEEGRGVWLPKPPALCLVEMMCEWQFGFFRIRGGF